MKKITTDKKLRRKLRVRSKIIGTAIRPRISVFRSNRYIYAQAIDDEKRVTLAAFSSLQLRKNNEIRETNKKNKKEEAMLVGLNLAKNLKEKEVSSAVFDRGIYAYKGRVKFLAQGLREGGIKI